MRQSDGDPEGRESWTPLETGLAQPIALLESALSMCASNPKYDEEKGFPNARVEKAILQ